MVFVTPILIFQPFIKEQEMKTASAIIHSAAAFFISALLLSTALSAAENTKKVFPFGIGTTGGVDGQVIKVTNLNKKGPGSLRAALETEGARIVVFEVGGVIDLGWRGMTIREPHLTIAGQTAPSPGITLIKGGIVIRTHDVIIQHIAVRPGNPIKEGIKRWESDAITTSAHGDAQGKVYNIVIDHCSGTWASDENMTVSGPQDSKGHVTTHDVFFRHCIIAEGLLHATHPKGAHSRGSLVMDGCSRIAYVGNLFAHNNQRHPLFKGGSSGILVNNLIVNPGNRCIDMISTGHRKHLGKPVVSVIGNVMIPGKNTRTGFFNARGDIYARGNFVLKSGKKHPVKNYGKTQRVWADSIAPLPADDVREFVLKNAGARPADRDPVDARIIRDCRSGKGRIINTQDQVGGFPRHKMTRRKLTVPKKDIQKWLKQMAKKVETYQNRL